MCREVLEKTGEPAFKCVMRGHKGRLLFLGTELGPGGNDQGAPSLV